MVKTENREKQLWVANRNSPPRHNDAFKWLLTGCSGCICPLLNLSRWFGRTLMLYNTGAPTLCSPESDGMRKVGAHVSGLWRPWVFTCAALTVLKCTLAGDFMATFIALNGVCLNVPRHHHNILAGPGRCVSPAAPDAEFYRTLLRVFMSHHGPDFTTDSLIFSNTRLWPLRNAIYGIPRGPIKRFWGFFCHGFGVICSPCVTAMRGQMRRLRAR